MRNAEKGMVECLNFIFSAFRIPTSDFEEPYTLYLLHHTERLPDPMPMTCHKCFYYFVTWDPQLPHGCRIMGFKSRRAPAIEVRRTMHGKDCLLFKAKKAAKDGTNLQKLK